MHLFATKLTCSAVSFPHTMSQNRAKNLRPGHGAYRPRYLNPLADPLANQPLIQRQGSPCAKCPVYEQKHSGTAGHLPSSRDPDQRAGDYLAPHYLASAVAVACNRRACQASSSLSRKEALSPLSNGYRPQQWALLEALEGEVVLTSRFPSNH
jgi:hypothetical protein